MLLEINKICSQNVIGDNDFCNENDRNSVILVS